MTFEWDHTNPDVVFVDGIAYRLGELDKNLARWCLRQIPNPRKDHES